MQWVVIIGMKSFRQWVYRNEEFATQHSPLRTLRVCYARDTATGTMCFAGAFSGSFRDLKLIPVKWRPLVPPRRIEPVEITSGYPAKTAAPRRAGQAASRWAANDEVIYP
jgi:hypothetical protein